MPVFMDALDSLTFLDQRTTATFHTMLRLEGIMLDRIGRQCTRDPESANQSLSLVREWQAFRQQIVSAANASLAFARNDDGVISRFAEKRLWRPPQIPRDEWLSAIAEVLHSLKWAVPTVRKTVYCLIANAAIELHKQEYGGSSKNRHDVSYFGQDSRRQVISLSDPAFEFVGEMPGAAEVVYEYRAEDLETLDSAVADDPEVQQYTAILRQNPRRKRETVWAELNWSAAQGKRVDRRYRNRRQKVRATRSSRTWTTRAPLGISDANSTIYFEKLYDGTHGKWIGNWQHRQLAPTRDCSQSEPE